MDSAVIRTVLAPRKSERLATGISVADPPCCGGRRQVVRNGTAGLSVPILGVRRTPVYRWKPGIWLTATSSSLSGVSGGSGVSPTAVLFTIVLGGTLGQRTGDGSGHQFTTGRGCYVVESTNTVPVCNGNEQDVIFDYGLGPRTIVVWAASYMSTMGLWHPQKNPDVPGPVPALSCHSCMSCKYCFPEDRLPPECTL